MVAGSPARTAPNAPELGRKIVVGLVGAGIGASRTPLMHEREGARLGLRYVYNLLDTDHPEFTGLGIAEIVRAALICGFAGLNVTHPHKQTVLAGLDRLSETAARVGAVNTVVFGADGSSGHNTDKWGFAESFRRQMAGAGMGRVALVGAGGAGAAVALALLELGAGTLLVCDVDRRRAQALAQRMTDAFGSGRAVVVDPAELAHERLDGLVNATPVGMRDLPGMPVSASILRPDLWVAEIIYFPIETELLRTARRVGCRTMSGEQMAVLQAVRAFTLFTGIEPDEARLWETFNSF